MKNREKKSNLTKIMEMVPKDSKPQANILYNEIQYLDELMEKLRAEIQDKGIMATTENYGQSFKKTNPSVECYDKLSKTKHKYLISLFKLVDKDQILADEEDELTKQFFG